MNGTSRKVFHRNRIHLVRNSRVLFIMDVLNKKIKRNNPLHDSCKYADYLIAASIYHGLLNQLIKQESEKKRQLG
jgi:hypothetical protein